MGRNRQRRAWGSALAVLLAVGSLQTAVAGTQTTALTVSSTVSMTDVTLSWGAPLPEPASVRIGIGADLPLVVPLTAAQSSVTVGGLKPGTDYAFAISGPAGQPRASGSFTTSPPVPAAFSVKGTNILLDGAPFFPVVKWGYVCADSIPSYTGFGVNVFAKVSVDYIRPPCPEDVYTRQPGGTYVSPKTFLYANAYPAFLDATAGKGWGVGLLGGATTPVPDAVASSPSLLGWCCNARAKSSPPQPQAGRVDFGGNSPAAVDVYETPLPRGALHSCGFPPPGTSLASAYVLAQKAARTHRPFFDVVALSTGRPACTPGAITPARVLAEAWLSLAGGATGIAYDTDISGVGAHKGKPAVPATDNGADPAVLAAVETLDQRLAELQPALLAPVVPTHKESNGPVRVGARRYAGVTYVIAVNPAKFATPATFAVQGAAGDTATVLWENRSVPVRDLRISDAFQPLAVHVYVVTHS